MILYPVFRYNPRHSGLEGLVSTLLQSKHLKSKRHKRACGQEHSVIFFTPVSPGTAFFLGDHADDANPSASEQ